MRYTIKHPQVLEECVQRYGVETHIYLLIEECGELLQALSKLRRNGTPKARANLEEEVADVLIMLNQMIHIFQMEDVQSIMDYKLDRLQERLAEWKKVDN